MVKQSIRLLRIKCRTCSEDYGTVEENLLKIDNKWDEDEPTEWVKQRLEANDLGVLTHLHIFCTTCNKDIAVLKLDFFSVESEAKITWRT